MPCSFSSRAAGLVLAIALMEAAAGYVMDVRLARAGERIVHDLRVAIYAQLQRLSLGFHQRRPTGDLVTRVTGDVNAVGTLFSSTLGTLVSAALTLVGMVVVGFLLDPVLAIVAFATAPVLAVIAFRFRLRMSTLAKEQRTMEGEIASLATEALSSIQQVKALGSERHEHERLERKSEERRVAGYEAILIEGRFTRIIDVLGAIGTAAVLVVGVFRVEAGATSPGDVVVMVSYAHRIYRPLRTMAREWVRLARAMARADRVAEILASDDALVERVTTWRDGRARGEVAFDGVSFAYEAGRPVLTDVSLTIPAGQRVAVVGRSGAGKSTFAALAARFYDPDAGRVLIDGVDVARPPAALDARPGRPRAPGRGPVHRDRRREHRAGGSTRTPTRSSAPPRPPARTGSSASSRRGTTPSSTRAGPACRAGSASASPSRGRSSATRPSSCSMSRRPGSTPRARPMSSPAWTCSCAGRTTVIISHSLALARRAERVVVLEIGTGHPGRRRQRISSKRRAPSGSSRSSRGSWHASRAGAVRPSPIPGYRRRA